MQDYRHISVIEEYNTFRNYYAEHEMKNTRDRFNRVRGMDHGIYILNRFIHLVNKYLLNTYFVPGSILGTWHSAVNKQKVFFSHGDNI